MNDRRLLSEKKYKYEVEKNGDYKYIKAYFKDDILPNGKKVGRQPYIKIQHLYCESEYIVQSKSFINEHHRCSKCCGSYENSFAHHIEVELGLKLEDVWDFEKNIVNPYNIYRNYNGKAWIKCREKDYHGSYKITCNHFVIGNGCSYCYGKSTHHRDSFGQWLMDNNRFHLWSDRNKVNPFTISKGSNKKIWMLCDRKDYHNDYGGYEISCANFINKKRCPYCASRKIHKYDSFAYLYPDKAKCWHEDNEKSPYEVARKSRSKYKFRCDECEHIWEVALYSAAIGAWCPSCNASKGEKRVKNWIRLNGLTYKTEVEFKGLVSDINKPLRYDFYLPNHNTLIEYDGLQHDKWIKSWMTKDAFEKLQYHDGLKDRYAKDNNIELIRIKEKDFDNIEKILEKELNL